MIDCRARCRLGAGKYPARIVVKLEGGLHLLPEILTCQQITCRVPTHPMLICREHSRVSIQGLPNFVRPCRHSGDVCNMPPAQCTLAGVGQAQASRGARLYNPSVIQCRWPRMMRRNITNLVCSWYRSISVAGEQSQPPKNFRILQMGSVRSSGVSTKLLTAQVAASQRVQEATGHLFSTRLAGQLMAVMRPG